MSNEDFLCARCARHQRTCCQDNEVYVTLGDVERIAACCGRQDFTKFIPPSSVYGDQDDDPVWRDQVFRPDGTRRVLQHQAGGDCTFLSASGCTLPGDVRPLVCRLYPFDYTAAGILDAPAGGCPLELLEPGQSLLPTLGMTRVDAERWQRQLYAEISSEQDANRPDLQVAQCSLD